MGVGLGVLLLCRGVTTLDVYLHTVTHLPPQHADLIDQAMLSKLHAQTGVTLLAKDGTFNDYSAVLPRYFPLVTEALAAFYRAALGHMCVAQGIRVADVTTFKVVCCLACLHIRHTVHACSCVGGWVGTQRGSHLPRHRAHSRHQVRQTGKIRARLCQETAGQGGKSVRHVSPQH